MSYLLQFLARCQTLRWLRKVPTCLMVQPCKRNQPPPPVAPSAAHPFFVRACLAARLVVTLSVAACSPAPPELPRPTPDPAPAPDAATIEDLRPLVLDLRGVPFEHEQVRLSSGQFVYSPQPRIWRAWTQGAGLGWGAYQLAQVTVAGVEHSTVTVGDAEPARLPNAALIALRDDPQLATGDVVLAPRQGAMVPAVVASLRDTQVVLYDLRESVTPGEEEFQALPMHLLPIEQGGAGSLMLCAGERTTGLYQLLLQGPQSLLALDGQRAPVVLSPEQCAALPPEPLVQRGQTVLAFLYGGLRQVQVVEIDAMTGRARVRFELAGRTQDINAPLMTLVQGEPAFGNLLRAPPVPE